MTYVEFCRELGDLFLKAHQHGVLDEGEFIRLSITGRRDISL
jgi:hypothetical protein